MTGDICTCGHHKSAHDGNSCGWCETCYDISGDWNGACKAFTPRLSPPSLSEHIRELRAQIESLKKGCGAFQEFNEPEDDEDFDEDDEFEDDDFDEDEDEQDENPEGEEWE